MKSLFLCGVLLLVLPAPLAHANGLVWQESAKTGASGGDDTHQPPTVSLKESKEHVIKRVNARNSPIAMAAHVAGTVTIGVEISGDGKVTQAVVLGGPEMLRASALDAAKQFEFRPFLMDGVARTVRTAIQFRYAPTSYTSF